MKITRNTGIELDQRLRKKGIHSLNAAFIGIGWRWIKEIR
jgi:hypothetical protein